MCRTPSASHAIPGFSIQSECVSGALKMSFFSLAVVPDSAPFSGPAANPAVATAAVFTKSLRVMPLNFVNHVTLQLSNHPPQHRQILHIVSHVLSLRRFQTGRMILESRIIHNVPKTFFPNFPPPNVLMTI